MTGNRVNFIFKKNVFFVMAITSFFTLVSTSINELPERKWLVQEYFPSLEGKVLFVGVGYYTTNYHNHVKTPKDFETLDISPERAKFGCPYKHHIGDFLKFTSEYKYDHICLFGVMGCHDTIVSEETIDQAFINATNLLNLGGTLQVGADIRTIPKYNNAYWQAKFKQSPLNKYTIINDTVGPFNTLWWGRKVID